MGNFQLRPGGFKARAPWHYLVMMLMSAITAHTTVGDEPSKRLRSEVVARAILAEKPRVEKLDNTVVDTDYAPDGKSIAVAMRDPNRVLVLDSATLAVRQRFDGHAEMVSRVRWTPDGKTLVSGGHDASIRVWDIGSGKERLKIDGFQGYVRGLAVGPDGSRIYCGEMVGLTEGSVQVWSARDGKSFGSFNVDNQSITALALSPDGKLLATTSRDRTLRIWDVAARELRNSVDGQSPYPYEPSFLPDGKSILAMWSDKSLRCFDASTLALKFRVETGSRNLSLLAISPDGAIAATTDGNRLRFWSTADGSSLGMTEDLGIAGLRPQFAPDGRTVLIGGQNGRIEVLRVEGLPGR